MILDHLRSLTGTRLDRPDLVASNLSYPSYQSPHVTGGDFIGIDPLKENLAHFLIHRDERLEQITSLLRKYDLDPELAITPGEAPTGFLDALDSWVTDYWRTGRISKKQLSRDFWTRHQDDGSSHLYGFLSDIGLLLGEILIAQRQSCEWGFDPMARKREHSSFVNRIVVAGLAVPADNTIPSFYDPGLSAFYALRTVRFHPDPTAHDLTLNLRARLTYYPSLITSSSPLESAIVKPKRASKKTPVTHE